MGGGSILKMFKKVYKDDPEAISAINETLSNNKKSKDTSEVDKRKIKKLPPNSESKKTFRDDSSITEEDKQKRKSEIKAELDKWSIKIYIEEEYICDLDYLGSLDEKHMLKLIEENFWDIQNLEEDYGTFKNCNVKFLM